MSDLTKDAILKEALSLFAVKGYSATSIRDISEAAGVNVASINYHFGSKHKLFQSVLIENMKILESSLKETLSDPGPSINTAVWKLYCCFLDNSESFLSVFKVMLSNNVEFPDSPIRLGEFIGPPGGQLLFEIIQQKSSDTIPDTALLWAVHMISTHVLHSVLLYASPFGQQKLVDLPFCQPDFKQHSLNIFVDSILEKISDQNVDWSPLAVS